MNMEPAKEFIGPVGPRGGDLNGSASPDFRRQAFSPMPLSNGEEGLHVFEDHAIVGIKNEKPWHAMAAMLLVEGKSNQDVAQLAGVSEVYISILKQQRWFQERMASLTNRVLGPRISRFSAALTEAEDKIVSLIDDPSPRIALAAATYISDQIHGKAVQKTISVSATATFASPNEEWAALQKDLEALRKAQKQPSEPPATSTEDQTTTQ